MASKMTKIEKGQEGYIPTASEVFEDKSKLREFVKLAKELLKLKAQEKQTTIDLDGDEKLGVVGVKTLVEEMLRAVPVKKVRCEEIGKTVALVFGSRKSIVRDKLLAYGVSEDIIDKCTTESSYESLRLL